MKPFDHRSGDTIDIDGASIYFEVAGRPESPPLLLLHGGFGTIDDFNGFLERLKADYRVVGIDSRGQGRSTLGPRPLSYARLQADVERVVAHLGFDRIGIVGVSDGGIVGYRLAAMADSKVDRLITVSARWHRSQAERTRARFVATSGDSQRREDPAGHERYVALNPEPDFERLATALVRMWLDPEPSGHPDDTVARITCPLLITHGDDDVLLTREAVVELAERVDGSHLLNIPFAKHAALNDQPEIFAIAVDRFLRE